MVLPIAGSGWVSDLLQALCLDCALEVAALMPTPGDAAAAGWASERPSVPNVLTQMAWAALLCPPGVLQAALVRCR
eukprot:12736471-Alexandrium_andersonii.AAC.1